MDSFSRRYYERELGAGIAPSPSLRESFGYTEPFRRFVQREDFSPQANALKNTMPSWLPGEDYLTNFQLGDPYTKVDQGYARLPGAGYEALQPDQVSPSCRNQKPSRARARGKPPLANLAGHALPVLLVRSGFWASQTSSIVQLGDALADLGHPRLRRVSRN